MDAHGKFIWNELNTWKPDAAKSFYTDTIGWSYEEVPMPEGPAYFIIKQGETRVGGIFTYTSPAFDGVADCWLPYLAVDDVDKRVDHAVTKGAKVIRPPFDIPGIGRMAVLIDGGGACLAWMTPKSPG